MVRLPSKPSAAAVLIAIMPSWAAAQSYVKIYGFLDAGVTRARAALGTVDALTPSIGYPSRIGFAGSEDLGGGLHANFDLEAGLNNDTGTGLTSNTNNQASGVTSNGDSLTFNRQSWVGMQSPWGEIRLGRSFTPTYRNYLVYDPFAGGGPFGSQAAFGAIAAGGNPGAIRSSNEVEYWSPTAARGFNFHAMYALGENPSTAGATADDGDYQGARLGYIADNFSVAAGYAYYNLASMAGLHEITLGAKYISGVHTLFGMYTKNVTGLAGDMDGWLAGYLLREGVWGVRASYSTSHRTNASGTDIGDARKLALSPEYYFSERTRAYVGYTRIKNSHGASTSPFTGGASINSANGGSSLLAVGMVHIF